MTAARLPGVQWSTSVSGTPESDAVRSARISASGIGSGFPPKPTASITLGISKQARLCMRRIRQNT